MNDKGFIKKYNQINILIAILVVVISGLSMVVGIRFGIITSLISLSSGYYAHNKNKQYLDSQIKTKRKQLLSTNNLYIQQSTDTHIDTEYLKSHLPKPSGLPIVKFEHTAIGKGINDSGDQYLIDFISYNGYKQDNKSLQKKFDMTGYLITLDFGDYQFCNRPLLYFNAYSSINNYNFQKRHKLAFRKPSAELVKISSAYHHHRLMAYDGFHDKYMKNVIQIIDFNPNLFKKKFCKAAIFDQSKLYFLIDDDIIPKIKLDYHYTQEEIADLVNNHQNQVDILKVYIEHLTKVNDGVVKTKKIFE